MFSQWGLFMIAPFPIIRDVASNAIGGFPYQISPVQGSAKAISEFVGQAKQGDIDKPLVRSAIKTFGVLGPTPLPTNQILLTGEYFRDYLNGTIDEFSVIEAFIKRDYQKYK